MHGGASCLAHAAADAPGGKRVRVGANKGYDAKDVIAESGILRITPAGGAEPEAEPGGSAIDGRTTRSTNGNENARVLRMAQDDRAGAQSSGPIASRKSAGCSPSRRLRATWSGHGSCWRVRLLSHEVNENSARRATAAGTTGRNYRHLPYRPRVQELRQLILLMRVADSA